MPLAIAVCRLVALLILLTVWISACAAQYTYNVYPTCPTNKECLTLSDIVNERDKYFTSNVTLVFHPGNHSLQDEAVFVANVSNLTLQGSTTSSSSGAPVTRIVCDNSSLTFSGVSDLKIASMNYVSCRSSLSLTVAVFQDCSFEDSTGVNGGAMAVTSGSNVTFLGLTVFSGNTATQNGGAIYADESVITFCGTGTFTDNYVNIGGDGGALYARKHNTLSFSGNSSFEGNMAEFGGGGAFCAEDNNTLSFSGTSNFEGNAAYGYGDGGAFYTDEDNTLSFSGTSYFKGNTAYRGGGAFYAGEDNTLSFSGNSYFKGNTAGNVGGGVLYAQDNNTLSFSGNSTFEANRAEFYGGVLYAWDNNTFSFSGNSTFEANRAGYYSGVLYAEDNNTLSFSGNSTFEANRAGLYGGVLYAGEDNTLSFSGNSNFEGNRADSGGVLYAQEHNTVSFSGNTSFEGNTAYGGGALCAWEDNSLSFSGNSTFEGNTADSGGALYAEENSTLSFTGNTSFEGNKATTTGGALSYSNCRVVFDGRTSFSSNTALFGGAIYAVNSITKLTESSVIRNSSATYGGGIFVQGGRITFQGEGSCTENTASQDGHGGAILAINSIMAFNGSYQLVENTAGFGGGISLVGIKDRTLFLEPGTNLSFNGNAAHKRGGALYVEDNPFTYCIFNRSAEPDVSDACFLQSFDPEQHVCNTIDNPHILNATGIQFNYRLNFESNTAVESGDILYGGDLDSCVICVKDIWGDFDTFNGSDVFAQVTNINMSSQFELSSDPYKVCICENNQPNCNQRTVNTRIYPGHMLSLAVVSVGQMDGVVPSHVIHAVKENLINTSDFNVLQSAENNKSCSELQYPLLSKELSARLKLYSEEPCFKSGFPLTVHITFLPCPVGFNLSDQGMCICEERLQKYTQSCVIQNMTINRQEGDTFWVGVVSTSKTEGLILHPHCPFDYCTEEGVSFTLNSTDLQCSNGRLGELCGGCQSGHSLALGSSRCLSGCSNKYLSLLLAFAAAGIVLVAFLFLCRLTVAGGTLSGLIFYANFLAVNRSIFFPPDETNILTVFIAWLNLDLGIETCFSVGLDAYTRTWLQFVFPIYIWVLVGLIIYLANLSTTFARIISRTNPVAVLATLFLLSYTKLLRAIMAAFSFTTLDYPDNESRLVWLYDGNVGYLDVHDGRHIILFVVSLLVFLFVFLPYTLLLLCGQWIQRKFQLRWISPKRRLYLKAFLDAYYAPFHDKNRYWTGLLLLLRFFIVLLSTLLNIASQNPSVSLVVLLCVVAGMPVWAWLVVHRLYRKWYLDVLEASFIFNLIVLIGGTYQIRQSGGNQAALVYTSISIAFTTFIGIVIIPVLWQVKKLCEGRWRAALRMADAHRSDGDDENESLHLRAGIPP